MKKHLHLLILMCIALSFSNVRAITTTPVDGTMYNIINHSTGLYLGIDTVNESGNARFQNASNTYTQAFQFYASGSGDSCYIKQVSTGKYLITSGDWNTSWTNDPTSVSGTNHANFYIKVVDDTYVVIYSSKGLLGADGANDGAWVYSNKSGESAEAYQWYIEEFVSNIDKTTLLGIITNATNFLNSTTAGENAGQYPQSAYTALSDSISVAQTVYNNVEATLVEITEAQNNLIAALAAYKQELILSIVTTPLEGSMYNILNDYSGLYMGIDTVTESGNARYQNHSSTTTQAFKFYYTGDDSCYIKQVSTGKYLIASGSWNTDWVDDPATVSATEHSKFIIKAVDDKNVVIYSAKGLLGTEGAGNGSWVYSNKSGESNTEYQWMLIDYTVDKSELLSAINSANEFISSTTIGSQVGEYPQVAYDAFYDSISSAQAVYDNAGALADDITAAIANLSTAFTNFKNAVNPLIPAIAQKYSLIHSSGFYLGTQDDGNYLKIIGTDSADTDNQFVFVATSTTGVYNIEQVSTGSFITKDSYNTVLGTDASSTNALFTVYWVEDGYYKIKCIGTKTYLGTDGVTDGSSVYSDKDGTSTNHFWGIQAYNSADADILTYSLDEQIKAAVISTEDTTITCTVAYLEDLNNLTVSYSLSDGAQASPTTVTDFSAPVTYKVTAENGVNIKYWKVTVEKASNEAEITSFTVDGISGQAIIDATNHTITVNVSSTTDLAGLEPSITISDGATITPSGVQDFSSDVVYTVTSEDATVTIDWTVSISKLSAIDNNQALNISMYPNPSSGKLYIENPSGFNEGDYLNIFSVLGECVFSLNIENQSDVVIDLNQYCSQQGLYFVKIGSADSGLVYKVIFQK